ncbi:MAG: DUF6508 domain-containing protein [Oscillospiraceae bacterium]|nr:DUF6508 domain-containing protein [Oscillospiraceae bacterium]
MYESLTSFLPLLKQDSIGEWVTDRENNGMPEHPIQMPFVLYTQIVDELISSIYTFTNEHPEYELRLYGDILKDNGIEWELNSMKNADVSKLDSKCVLALLTGAVRAERFCDGALLDFFKNGCIEKWLERLEEIDNTERSANLFK